jgi:Animal haem peroxidase
MNTPQETTPTIEKFHGTLPPRGLESTPSSSTDSGRFGRMFRHLPYSSPNDEALADLGQKMIQPRENGLDKSPGEEDEDENTAVLENGELRLPAGYTYFGQFVDHDITFDPISSLTRQNDPDGLKDFRTPRFDLDSLYGRGPADQPYLYESDELHLALGREVPSPSSTVGRDLLRTGKNRAIIGDPRNDENLIVSQLQATMIQFHNRVLDKVGADHPNLSRDEVFKLAQQQVRWHYQWVVVHDFLERLVGKDVVDDILRPESFVTPGGGAGSIPVYRPRFYRWDNEPYMPIEFSVAAYRFGHSMARPSYLINEAASTTPPIEGVNRIRLFLPGPQEDAQKLQSLNGFRELPDQWTVQWRFLLAGIKDGSEPNANLPQPSYKLDAQLAIPLGELPDSVANPNPFGPGPFEELAKVLAARNLFRGKRVGLPSGQDVALAMGIPPLADDELFDGIPVEASTKENLAGRAPLWFYILKEAEVQTGSAHLGAVGGRLVAEVLIGLLAGDPLSFLGVRPSWKPILPASTEGHFTLSDLINFAIPAPDAPPPPPPYGG